MPPIGQVHIDQALTNVSIMYRNEYYRADEIFVILPVDLRSDKFFVYDKASFLSSTGLNAAGKPNSLRRPGAEAAEIDHSVGTQNYYCEEYALRDIVPDAEQALADTPLDPQMDVTINLTERLKIDNEVSVAGIAATRANYPASNHVTLTTGASGTSWAQYASAASNPFNDIKNGKLAVLAGIVREPNAIQLNPGAARTLADHPTVTNLIKYTHPESLTMSGLLKVIRGLDVIEALAQRNNAVEGAAFAGGNIWQADDGTDEALIFYRTARPGRRTVTMGHTFEAPDDTTRARGFSVRKWRDDARKGMMVEVAVLRDWRIVAQNAGGLNLGGYLVTGCTL